MRELNDWCTHYFGALLLTITFGGLTATWLLSDPAPAGVSSWVPHVFAVVAVVWLIKQARRK